MITIKKFFPLAFVSDVCDPCSILVLAVSCRLSLLLVLAMLRGFFSGFSSFLPSKRTDLDVKAYIDNSPRDWRATLLKYWLCEVSFEVHKISLFLCAIWKPIPISCLEASTNLLALIKKLFLATSMGCIFLFRCFSRRWGIVQLI